jgi:hypothetical protein
VRDSTSSPRSPHTPTWEVRDRVRSNSFGLTQEFIAQMLGANRTTLSLAMSQLKEEGLIDYSRGKVDLLDVPGLQIRSCECFALLQSEYVRLLGPPQSHIAR